MASIRRGGETSRLEHIADSRRVSGFACVCFSAAVQFWPLKTGFKSQTTQAWQEGTIGLTKQKKDRQADKQ